MEWLLVAFVGATIGLIAGVVAQTVRMPSALSLAIGIVGGLCGGMLARLTGLDKVADWSFYVAGGMVATAFLAGGVLGYGLTNEEKRT